MKCVNMVLQEIWKFEPITKLDNFHSYVLKSNPSTLARYPYDFELYNTYRLDGNKLTTMYRVINTGLIAMPFGIGGHPAFKIDANELKVEIITWNLQKMKKKYIFYIW